MNEDAKSATDNVLCLAWLGRSERIFFPEGNRGRALFRLSVVRDFGTGGSLI